MSRFSVDCLSLLFVRVYPFTCTVWACCLYVFIPSLALSELAVCPCLSLHLHCLSLLFVRVCPFTCTVWACCLFMFIHSLALSELAVCSCLSIHLHCLSLLFVRVYPFTCTKQIKSKNASMHTCEKVYGGCVRSCMLHGSEPWPVRKRKNYRSVGSCRDDDGWMDVWYLRQIDRYQVMYWEKGWGLRKILSQCYDKNRFRWYGRVSRQDAWGWWVTRCLAYEVEDLRRLGKKLLTMIL